MKRATAIDDNQDQNNSQAENAEKSKNISQYAESFLSSCQNLWKSLSQISFNLNGLMNCVSERYSAFKAKHQFNDSTIFKAAAFTGGLFLLGYIGRDEIKAGFAMAKEVGIEKSDIIFKMMPESAQSAYNGFSSFVTSLAAKLTGTEAELAR